MKKLALFLVFAVGLSGQAIIESTTPFDAAAAAAAAAADDSRHSIDTWIGVSGDAVAGSPNAEQILSLFDGLIFTVAEGSLVFNFPPESIAGTDDRGCGYARAQVPTECVSNYSVTIKTLTDATAGNLRWSLRWLATASGESYRQTQILSEPNFATCDNWDLTGDFACAGGKLVYTHSSGIGTATQASGDFLGAAIADMPYGLKVTTSDVAGGGPTCEITTAFAEASTSLYAASDVIFTTGFYSAAAPGNLVIDCTSGAGDAASFDDLELRAIYAGKVGVTQTVPATAYQQAEVEFTGITAVGNDDIWLQICEDYPDALNTLDAAMYVMAVQGECDE